MCSQKTGTGTHRGRDLSVPMCSHVFFLREHLVWEHLEWMLSGGFCMVIVASLGNILEICFRRFNQDFWR
jgi:hypothetical protein